MIHTDSKGNVYPIASMQTEHIKNYINLILDKCSSELDNFENQLSDDDLFNELNGVEKKTKQEVVSYITGNMKNLYPYIFEIVVRNESGYLENISFRLSRLLKRNKANSKINRLIQ